MAMKGNKTIPCIKASNNFPEQNNGLILHLIHRTETFDVDSIYIYICTYIHIFHFSYLKLVLLHTNIQNSIRLQENPTTNFGKRIPLLTKLEGEVINTQKNNKLHATRSTRNSYTQCLPYLSSLTWKVESNNTLSLSLPLISLAFVFLITHDLFLQPN